MVEEALAGTVMVEAAIGVGAEGAAGAGVECARVIGANCGKQEARADTPTRARWCVDDACSQGATLVTRGEAAARRVAMVV